MGGWVCRIPRGGGSCGPAIKIPYSMGGTRAVRASNGVKQTSQKSKNQFFRYWVNSKKISNGVFRRGFIYGFFQVFKAFGQKLENSGQKGV